MRYKRAAVQELQGFSSAVPLRKATSNEQQGRSVNPSGI